MSARLRGSVRLCEGGGGGRRSGCLIGFEVVGTVGAVGAIGTVGAVGTVGAMGTVGAVGAVGAGAELMFGREVSCKLPGLGCGGLRGGFATRVGLGLVGRGGFRIV